MAITLFQDTRRRKRIKWFLRGAIFFLALWMFVAWIAARVLIVSAELRHADALVVLSGGAAYVERARRAAQLFNEGRAPKIILTNDGVRGGWSSSQQRNPLFFERAIEELHRSGVPYERIEVLPPVVSSTYEEAVLLRDHTAARGLHSMMIVTSAYHSRRALWTLRRVFQESGIEVGVSAVPPGWQTPRHTTWWWQAEGWRVVAGEYLKLVYYWLQYR